MALLKMTGILPKKKWVEMDFEIVLGGNGFYYNSKYESVPTFIDLRDFIEKTAYCKWQQANKPITDGFDFWLVAEKIIWWI